MLLFINIFTLKIYAYILENFDNKFHVAKFSVNEFQMQCPRNIMTFPRRSYKSRYLSITSFRCQMRTIYYNELLFQLELSQHHLDRRPVHRNVGTWLTSEVVDRVPKNCNSYQDAIFNTFASQRLVFEEK